ncbi:MAG: hypothetical protein Ct9H300mP11_23810 [Chloroflexota bacterium]|nr:MAG: hypothetical protein Ct9H300mP11_23810 [Chloroflexota bacterium]
MTPAAHGSITRPETQRGVRFLGWKREKGELFEIEKIAVMDTCSSVNRRCIPEAFRLCAYLWYGLNPDGVEFDFGTSCPLIPIRNPNDRLIPGRPATILARVTGWYRGAMTIPVITRRLLVALRGLP